MEQPKQPAAQQQNPFAKLEDLLQKQNALLSTLTQQTIIANRVHDGKMRFSYRDRWFTFSLPEASGDLTQRLMVAGGGFKDLRDLENLAEYLKPDSVVVDAGANIGNHTVWFASHPYVTRVYAFEPQATVFGVLKENIELNELQDKAELFQCALGDGIIDKVSISAYSPSWNIGGTAFRETPEGTYSSVTLDSMDLKRLDLFKIDVEGMQLEVLKGSTETIKRCKPVIYVEMLNGPQEHTRNTYNKEHEVDAPKRLLSDFNYEIRRVTASDYLAIPR